MFQIRCFPINSSFLSVSIQLIYFIEKVFGDVNIYCESGLCEDGQYCCGEQLCCKKTVDLWQFWAGICLIVIAILVLIGYYFGIRRKKVVHQYSELNQEEIVS